MKVRTTALLLAVALFSSSVLAESPCIECRKAALLEVQKCMASAKTEAEKSACTKKGQDLTKSCDNGACKSSMGK